MTKNQKTKDITTIKECFDVILNNDKEESCLAARRVRKLLFSSQGEKNKNKYQDIKNIVNNAPDKYVKILEDWRQENFVTAISVIYFLRDKEKQPDFLFLWFFQLLQHPNGNIRYAAVKMISIELGPLTVHLRFPGKKSIIWHRLKPEEADNILNSLFINLQQLLSALWKSTYKKYKYIDSLPPSPYKSVQMVLAEMEELCGKEYLDHLTSKNTKPTIQAKIDKLKKMGLKGKMNWEIDYSETNYYLQDENGERIKPLLFVIAHPESCFVIKGHLTIPAGDYSHEFLNELLDSLENSEFYPSKILVKKKDLYDLFSDLLEDLKIDLELVKSTSAADYFKRESDRFFKK